MFISHEPVKAVVWYTAPGYKTCSLQHVRVRTMGLTTVMSVTTHCWQWQLSEPMLKHG